MVISVNNRKHIIIILFLFFIISVLTIYSTSTYLDDKYMLIKQIIFYILGFIIIFTINDKKKEKMIQYSSLIYIILNILLLLVLLIGKEINGAKAWFTIPKIGSFQPSEFMKIGLILVLAKEIDKYNQKKKITFKSDLLLILKLSILTIIPSLLTFLEPDTGAVIIYLIIYITMLYLSNINRKWFYIIGTIIVLIILVFIGLYLFKQDLFIKILGTSILYRLDRIIDWLNGKGMQLENSMISIGSTKLFGNGIKKILVYYPYPATDFIFASFTTTFGLVGALILIVLIISFDLRLLKLINIKKSDKTSYIIISTTTLLLYQQIQNISMTIGLLPITGITLPFISYGGSSLISNMILLSLSITKKMH